MNTREKVAALEPLANAMYRGHCWIKGENGPRHISEPFDDFKLAEHAAGRKAYGLCPIAPGESVTRVACLDLDSHKGETPWHKMREIADNLAFTFEQYGLTPIMFRSSGGNGIHIYLMWKEPQDAYSVREMLKGLIAPWGFKPGTGGVGKGQIEVFPKQDSVPADGCGSMFILPGSGRSELLD